MTLKKVQQSAAKAAAKAATREAKRPTALAAVQHTTRCKLGNSKLGISEAARLELGRLALSKPSDNNGMDYAVDARKKRKQNKPAAEVVRKESDFGSRTATWGSKTDATINSYYRNKRGDNMPRNAK